MTQTSAALERGTGRAVVWLARQVELVLASHVELTLAQYRLLALLAERPAVASELADKLAVSRPSVTTVADGLVQRGLVERVNDTLDRRRVNHTLTPAGRRLIRKADEIVETGLGVVLDHLDARDAHSMAAGFSSLQRLAERVSGWQETEP
jgi:DNA-binding MarR family transcriptional regulator